MKFLSLAEHPDYAHELIWRMEHNSDWCEILPWLREMVDRCGKKKLPIVTMAFDGEDMIGFFVITDKELLKNELPYTPWLGILMIFYPYRGCGFSPSMIEEACAQTAQTGYDNLYLTTEHIRYYERFGFEEIGLTIYQWGAPTKIYRRKVRE